MAPLIDKIRMKKCNLIPIVHCAILGQVHDEELSNCWIVKAIFQACYVCRRGGANF